MRFYKIEKICNGANEFYEEFGAMIRQAEGLRSYYCAGPCER
jgi:hypothetical protein